MSDETQLGTVTYSEYHQRVVNACCALMGEEHRTFFDKQCSYEEEYVERTDPAEVAQAQWEALT